MCASETACVMDESAIKFGLLMESAQAHQKLAETHLERLRAHTQDLDGVVREEIRRTLIEEFGELAAETQSAVRALDGMKRAANLRGLTWSLVMTAASTAIPFAVVHWALPSTADIEALRLRRDSLQENVIALERRGGRIDWRRCGADGRLCVRVDKTAPAYGDKADYYVVEGY
jgi:hypothetical protein